MQVWDHLISAVCRPHRIDYKTNELLGGINGSRLVGRTIVRRQDFVITNHKDERLQCSYWQTDGAGVSAPLPAVIYCHCNSGSRLDAVEAIWTLVPLGVRVFALDFSGSGISEGEYVTLGANEVEDLTCLVQFIRDGGHTSTVALWGRSMGAVTALLYSERDPSVAGIVLDSPFTRLTDLMRELAEEQNVPLWGLVGSTAMKLMRRSVKKRAGFDINIISPLDHAPRAFIPAFFGHASSDSFVKAHHTQRLHTAYAGDKELMLFGDECDHNSPRPNAFYESVRSFVARALHLSAGGACGVQALADTRRMMPGASPGATHSMSPFQVPSHMDDDPDSDGEEADVGLQTALQLSMQELAVTTGVAPCSPFGAPNSNAAVDCSQQVNGSSMDNAHVGGTHTPDAGTTASRGRRKKDDDGGASPRTDCGRSDCDSSTATPNGWVQPGRNARARGRAIGDVQHNRHEATQEDACLQAAIAASLLLKGPDGGHASEAEHSDSRL